MQDMNVTMWIHLFWGEHVFDFWIKIHFVCPIKTIVQKHAEGKQILIERMTADPHDFVSRSRSLLKCQVLRKKQKITKKLIVHFTNNYKEMASNNELNM